MSGQTLGIKYEEDTDEDGNPLFD